MIALALCAAAAYWLGAIPIGYLFGRARGIDLRHEGSGNIGATNAVRALGWPSGLAVLVLDAAKGWIAAGPLATGLAGPSESAMLVGGIAAVAGHCWSPWLGMKGGKGVATGMGALTIWSPAAAIGAVLVWLIVAATTRLISAASLCAAMTALISAPTLDHLAGGVHSRARFGAILALVCVIGWRHRTNVGRLRAGTERPLTPRASGPTDER